MVTVVIAKTDPEGKLIGELSKKFPELSPSQAVKRLAETFELTGEQSCQLKLQGEIVLVFPDHHKITLEVLPEVVISTL